MEIKSNNKKRILFILTRKFWPTNSGHDVVLHNYCKCLYKLFNYEIYVYYFSNNKLINKKPDFIKEEKKAPKVNFYCKLKNIIWNTFLFNKKPLQMALYESQYCFNDIQKYCLKIKPNIVYFDMVRLSMYKEAISPQIKKILMMDDLLSKRYYRQINNNNSRGNILGYYANFMPKYISKLFNNNFLKNIILNFEAKRMEKWEKKSCLDFDYVTLVSPIEVKALKEKTKKDNIVCVPMVVDCNNFIGKPNLLSNDLVFVGNFSYAPNVDSLAYIIDEVFPYIKSSKVYLNVIGFCPETIRKKYSNKPFINFRGRVNDLKNEVQSSLIFLAPIVYGTGIKTKIIEAMAMGMPVITNEIGAEGIHAKRDIAFIVKESAKEIALAVDRLIENKELCLEMGKNAAMYVEKNHNWKNMYDAFIELDM